MYQILQWKKVEHLWPEAVLVMRKEALPLEEGGVPSPMFAGQDGNALLQPRGSACTQLQTNTLAVIRGFVSRCHVVSKESHTRLGNSAMV